MPKPRPNKPIVTGPFEFEDSGHRRKYKTVVKVGNTVKSFVFRSPEIAKQSTAKIKKELGVK